MIYQMLLEKWFPRSEVNLYILEKNWIISKGICLRALRREGVDINCDVTTAV